MSPRQKSTVSLTGIDDILLGSVGAAIPPSESLDNAIRLFGTWSGTDKLMMTVQYAAKLLIPLLQLRAEVQHRAGRRLKPLSPTSEGLFKLASQLSLARRVSGLWGVLAIIKALSALEHSRPPSRTKLTLKRLQGLSMLIYYPLEYVSFFSSPFAPLLAGVSPSMSAKAQLWSIRAWGVFVALQIVLFGQDWNSIARRDREEDNSADGKGQDIATLKKRKSAIVYGLAANISRLPVILHWSIVGGVYKNELYTNILSFVSAVAALKGGWEASRLSPSNS